MGQFALINARTSTDQPTFKPGFSAWTNLCSSDSLLSFRTFDVIVSQLGAKLWVFEIHECLIRFSEIMKTTLDAL